MGIVNEQNVTDVVVSKLNSDNPRINQVMESLIRHLHSFIREVNLTDEEWIQGIQFLTKTGQKCDDVRQEFILLSDVLGCSILKDMINYRKPAGATEQTVLGPFHRENAPLLENGSSMAGNTKGDPCVVSGQVTNLQGKPIHNAVLDVWHAAPNGLYEQQDPDQADMNLRAKFKTGADGRYHFYTIKPKFYGIPTDGPVGDLIKLTGRHPYRPMHIHFILTANGYEPVIMEVFDKDDPYIDSDAVFGVKESMLCEFSPVKGEDATALGLKGDGWKVDYDFVLNSI